MRTSWLLQRYLSDTDSNYVCVSMLLYGFDKRRLDLNSFQRWLEIGSSPSWQHGTTKIIGGVCLCFESDSNSRLHCNDVSGHRVTSVFGCRVFFVTFDKKKKIAELRMEKCTWLLSHALVTAVLDAGGWLSFHALPILSLGQSHLFALDLRYRGSHTAGLEGFENRTDSAHAWSDLQSSPCLVALVLLVTSRKLMCSCRNCIREL